MAAGVVPRQTGRGGSGRKKVVLENQYEAPDDDVAESAFSAWVSALEEHGTSGRVAAIISAAGIIQQNSSHGGMQAPHGAPPPRR